ncbi:hypothetical protein ACQPZA_28050 [Pseudonocardia xinjiangensis]|uniref:hypothetical protein n=1 Tax=Pseudonocardia xinjiangensis TaxID=75289 RepID=UPI003D94E882
MTGGGDVMRAVADWWDAVELWITQLPFPLQVVLAIVVVLPLCWGTSAGVDRLVDLAAAQLGRDRPNGP